MNSRKHVRVAVEQKKRSKSAYTYCQAIRRNCVCLKILSQTLAQIPNRHASERRWYLHYYPSSRWDGKDIPEQRSAIMEETIVVIACCVQSQRSSQKQARPERRGGGEGVVLSFLRQDVILLGDGECLYHVLYMYFSNSNIRSSAQRMSYATTASRFEATYWSDHSGSASGRR